MRGGLGAGVAGRVRWMTGRQRALLAATVVVLTAVTVLGTRWLVASSWSAQDRALEAQQAEIRHERSRLTGDGVADSAVLAQQSAAARAAADATIDRARAGIPLMLAAVAASVLACGWWLVRANRRNASALATSVAADRFQALVESSHEQVYLLTPSGDVVYSSPSAARAWKGRVPTTAAGLVAGVPESYRTALLGALAAGDISPEPTLMSVRSASGATRRLEFVPLDRRDDPALGGIVLTVRDVTEAQELQRQLARQAFEDELTGLPNRRSLNRALGAAVARSVDRSGAAALVLVDLDGFKGVNDTLGHPLGDELLRQVAARLRQAATADATMQGTGGAGCTVGRMGGDEFAVVLDSVADAGQAEAVARRLLDALRHPYDLEGNQLAIKASVGLAASDGECLVDDLFRRADIALYEAKQHGRNRVVTFEAHMEHLVVAQARLQRELAAAHDHGELSLVYQPLCAVSTGEPVGFEALMRWHSPALGEVPPATFIPVAERSGLIVELGRWALEEACRQLADWQRHLPGRPMRMSVNVSPIQVMEASFVADVRAALDAAGLAPGDLQLEVTESALANDLDRLAAQLATIRALGVRIALDDFGTGYSSMGQLQQLPVDCIKIDRSFIAALRDGGERAQSVVDALVDLGAALGLSVVAEGIEDSGQLAAISRPDCQLAQGYLLARPMRPDDALAFVVRAVATAPHHPDALAG